MAQPVLALVDASIYWKPVCELAVWASKALNAPVRLMYVLKKSDDDSTLPYDIVKNIDDHFSTDFAEKMSDSSASYARLMQELGQKVLDEAKDYVKKYAGIEVETKLRFDSLPDAISYYSKTSSLTIIGKQALQSATNGKTKQVCSNSETIVCASQRAVLVASQKIRPITNTLFLYDEIRMNAALDYFLCHHLFGGKNCFLGFSQEVFPAISKEIVYFRSLLEREDIHISSLPLNDNYEENLHNVIEDNNINLIVLSAFNESKFEKIILGSIYKILIQKIKVPVLVVRNNNLSQIDNLRPDFI